MFLHRAMLIELRCSLHTTNWVFAGSGGRKQSVPFFCCFFHRANMPCWIGSSARGGKTRDFIGGAIRLLDAEGLQLATLRRLVAALFWVFCPWAPRGCGPWQWAIRLLDAAELTCHLPTVGRFAFSCAARYATAVSNASAHAPGSRGRRGFRRLGSRDSPSLITLAVCCGVPLDGPHFRSARAEAGVKSGLRLAGVLGSSQVAPHPLACT
jgi:hypothetical protein